MPKRFQVDLIGFAMPDTARFAEYRQAWVSTWEGYPLCEADVLVGPSGFGTVETHEPEPQPDAPVYRVIENKTRHEARGSIHSGEPRVRAPLGGCDARRVQDDSSTLPPSGYWLEHTWAFNVMGKEQDNGIVVPPPPVVDLKLNVQKFTGTVDSNFSGLVNHVALQPPGLSYGLLLAYVQYGVKIHGNVPREVQHQFGGVLRVSESWTVRAPESPAGEGEEMDAPTLAVGDPTGYRFSSFRGGQFTGHVIVQTKGRNAKEITFKANSGGFSPGLRPEPFYVTFYAQLQATHILSLKAGNTCVSQGQTSCQMDYDFMLQEG